MNYYAVCIGAVTFLGAASLSAQTTPDGYSEWEKEIAQSFAELDSNRNGVLDPEEVEGHPSLETHFPIADMDGDGSITVEEFATFDILVDSIESSQDSSI